MFLARWTHGPARDGTVPLCGDDIWNPQVSLASPHRGLMRQPATVLFLCAEMIYGAHRYPLHLRTVDS